jgi:hypothetical protein
VAAYVEFTARTALPKIGHVETDTLDFKGALGRKNGKVDQFGLAKDLAAFANAQGGVILLGAYEVNGSLSLLRGMPADEVRIVRDAYSDAAKDFCRPSPVHNAVVLPYTDGSLVAVNVWPFPGQAVGVRLDSGGEHWCFPVRRGIDTPYLTPEQLPMLMLPELRRKLSLLRSIENDSKVTIIQGHHTANEEWRFKGVAEEDNAVHFDKRTAGSAAREEVHVALEQVERVWRRHGNWWMHVGPLQRGR